MAYHPADPFAPTVEEPWSTTADAPRSRTKLWIAVAVAVVLLGAGGGLAARFVFAKKVFDAAALNRDIAAQYKDRFTQSVVVDCPTNQEVKAGRTFDCSIKDSSKTIVIEVKDDQGTYLWRVSGG